MKVTIHFSVYVHHNSFLFNVKDVANEIRGQFEKHRNNIDLEVNIGNQVTYGQIDSFMDQLLLSLDINPEDKRRTNNIAFGETVKNNDSLELAIRGITYYFDTDAIYSDLKSVKGIDFSTFPKYI